jgi:tRNA threonylcarbamoyladenosine biosynthesis protein TsaB
MGAGAPLILALETATRTASLALLRAGEVLGEAWTTPGVATAEGLLPALDALLARCDVALPSLDVFAVSIGPGSFTSLRVGIASVKGLAFRSGPCVVAVPTLAALARSSSDPTLPAVALLDARRGEVYAAARSETPGVAADWLPESVYSREALAERLPASCLLVGEGVELCGDWLRERLGSGVRIQAPAAEPLARQVGLLGAELWDAGAGVEARALVPRYLRRAEAEVVRTGVRFEGPDPA